MPPVTVPSELWGQCSMSQTVDVDCLLPNGLFINITCSRDITLQDLRVRICEEASRISYFDDLKLPDSYVFVSVNQEAKSIEYYDYSKRLCDLKLFYLFFKLIEAEGNLEEKLLNANISKAIGLYVNEIEQSKDIELTEFRLDLFLMLRVILEEQLRADSTELIEKIYTPYLEIDPTLLDVGIEGAVDSMGGLTFGKNDLAMIEMDVRVTEAGQPETTYHLQVPLSWTPVSIICRIIEIKVGTFSKSHEEIEAIVREYKDAYMLNVCGCDEVFHGDKCKIGSYKVFN